MPRYLRLWVFPYTAQPAGEDRACGLRVRSGYGDLCANERVVGAKGFFGLRAFGVLADQACLDYLDDLYYGFLDGVDQARNERRAIFSVGVTGNVRKSVLSGVEAEPV